MSLILEALRKSEAERRRGLPPDLHVEQPPIQPRQRASLPAWAWAVLVAAILLFIAGWLWSQRGSQSSPSAETAGPEDPASPTIRPVVGAPPARPELPARTPAAPTTPSPGPIAQEKPEAAPEPTEAKPVEAKPVETRRAEAPPPAVEPAVDPAPRTPSPAAPPRPSAGRTLNIGELDADTRKALPPLRMSMHVWNEVPAKRFVILDGQRVSEGDRIGEASIAGIERDGVLLEWQGRRIRVPVR